ncbi:solute carrier family 23 member 1-like [Bubalus kerabau]|uniref:solute carrier family 23 member 1-like n=1 Tax=Bubalus carabanensis TaxID=3119969 RepID=UPI00244EC6C1|nr:solute carrier family 23 member 1-like [Bubalus carabanensis]
MSSAITTCEHPNPLHRGDGVLSSHEGDQGSKKDGQLKSPSSSHMAYGILDIPPWYLCIFLGIQHFLTALGGLVAVPLILAKDLCLQHDPLTQSYLISTTFFVSGICTLLQVLLGISYSLGDHYYILSKRTLRLAEVGQHALVTQLIRQSHIQTCLWSIPCS